MNVYCLRSFGNAKVRFDLFKKVTTFFQGFFVLRAFPNCSKRTKIFQGFQGFQGSVTDRFRAVDVMVMTRIATPALHVLASSAWKPLEHVRAAKSIHQLFTDNHS